MMIDGNLIARKITADHVRWVLVTCFWYFLVVKALLLLQVGLAPFAAITRAAGVHENFKYLVVAALVIEAIFVFGVWFKRTVAVSVLLAICLCAGGSVLSIYSLVFKLNSNCGCGLLGQNEFGLLAQKVFLLILLIILFRKRTTLGF